MRIGIIGAGNIAHVIADHADCYKVVCVYDAVGDAARDFSREYGCDFLYPDDFPGKDLDLVVEAASQGAVREYGENILKKKNNLMVMSVGAFVDSGLFKRMLKAAEENNARLVIPSGAIAGLDGLRSASVGKIYEVTLTTSKPPASLGLGNGQDTGARGGVRKKATLFEGRAREAVKEYPKNVNVAASLSLLGIGFERTVVKIVADPKIKSNQHEILVRGEFGEMRSIIRNVPSPKNPKTSYLAAMSAVSAIRNFKGSLLIG